MTHESVVHPLIAPVSTVNADIAFDVSGVTAAFAVCKVHSLMVAVVAATFVTTSLNKGYAFEIGGVI
jgi:Na+-transporting NADH:ubiquinone oxidoreductase subunit NqrD